MRKSTMHIDEAWVKNKVKDVLKKHKVYYFMPVAGRFGTAGIPDFVCCISGLFLGIETKANGNKPTELQLACHSKICRALGVVLVIDEHNIDTLDNKIAVLKDLHASQEQRTDNESQ